VKSFLNHLAEINLPLGAGSIRHEGLHRKLSNETFKWYKLLLGTALQSSVAIGPNRFKEFDGKKTKEGMIQPKSEEDLENAFKLIKKYIARHKTGQWAKQDRDKLKEIISEFGL
jgi:hypothetical protein